MIPYFFICRWMLLLHYLEYCSVMCFAAHKKDLNRIHLVQNKASRVVLRCLYSTSIDIIRYTPFFTWTPVIAAPNTRGVYVPRVLSSQHTLHTLNLSLPLGKIRPDKHNNLPFGFPECRPVNIESHMAVMGNRKPFLSVPTIVHVILSKDKADHLFQVPIICYKELGNMGPWEQRTLDEHRELGSLTTLKWLEFSSSSFSSYLELPGLLLLLGLLCLEILYLCLHYLQLLVNKMLFFFIPLFFVMHFEGMDRRQTITYCDEDPNK